MTNLVKIGNTAVASKILEIRGTKAIIDSDIADLYGVETKRINEAVRNNPEKCPLEYVFELTAEEKSEVVENFDHLEKLKFSPNLPKAFSEKGLYMLATILKSPVATQTTMNIIQTFARVREIKRTVIDVVKIDENSSNQKKIIERVGSLVGELIMPDEEDFETVEIHKDAKFKFMGMLEFSKKLIKKPKKKSN